MSHPHRELLAGIYDSLAQGDVGPLVASLADDIEWRVHRPSPVAGTYRGEREVLGFFPRMMAPYEGTLRVQVTSIVADDEHGFVSVREAAERPTSGLAWTGVRPRLGIPWRKDRSLRELLRRRLLRVLVYTIKVSRRHERVKLGRGLLEARR